MAGPSGKDSPSPVGPFLIWQQPHPIFYAELCYRAHPNRATLKRFETVVMQTAEFMASYAEWETNRNRFVLGPVLQCAQEIFPKDKTLNPTFELTYWRWALEAAQTWRQRTGLPREVKWDCVLKDLAELPIEQDKYLFAETATGTYTDKKWTDDHPSVTAALGILPGPGVDPETMRRTLDWIWGNWNWPDTWGWDYGMLAMCAARLGEPERAIDALLLDTPKNHIGINGHNYQRPGLTIYLPGNGSLLYAAAMMAQGWDGAPKKPAPGFPDNGQWKVRYEGLRTAP
jgi:protein-glucosylgalactosylhydroxylysine glucosidase